MSDPIPRYKSEFQQVKSEHEQFIIRLRDAKVNSYLEIGSHAGGSLWAVATSLPAGSRIVSVDYPNGDTAASLQDCVAELNSIGYVADLIIGDSTRHDIVAAVARGGAPYDCVFIDANHTLPYVTADYKNYGQMAHKILAFHDIADVRDSRPGRKPIEVKKLWDQLKGEVLNYEEIIHSPGTNGIGLIYVD